MTIDIAPHRKQMGGIVKSMLDTRNGVIYVFMYNMSIRSKLRSDGMVEGKLIN